MSCAGLGGRGARSNWRTALWRVHSSSCSDCASSPLQLGMFALQLGVLSTFLSEPVVKALTSGAALHVLVSQLPSLLGLPLPRQIGCFSLFKVGVENGREAASSGPGKRETGKGRTASGGIEGDGGGGKEIRTTWLNEGRCGDGSPDGSREALPWPGGSALRAVDPGPGPSITAPARRRWPLC